jgi:chromosome condensin MukBEF ATPase and DNA-binding subunit MukB
MVRILPTSTIKLPAFVFDEAAYIREPSVPLICRDQISQEHQLDNYMELALQKTTRNSILEVACTTSKSYGQYHKDKLGPVSGDIDSEPAWTGIQPIIVSIDGDESGAAALLELRMKEKESLATIQTLEARIAEQNRQIAETEAIREEILDALHRDHEKRVTQLVAGVQEAYEKRVEHRQAKPEPDFARGCLLGPCYSAVGLTNACFASI